MHIFSHGSTSYPAHYTPTFSCSTQSTLWMHRNEPVDWRYFTATRGNSWKENEEKSSDVQITVFVDEVGWASKFTCCLLRCSRRPLTVWRQRESLRPLCHIMHKCHQGIATLTDPTSAHKERLSASVGCHFKKEVWSKLNLCILFTLPNLVCSAMRTHYVDTAVIVRELSLALFADFIQPICAGGEDVSDEAIGEGDVCVLPPCCLHRILCTWQQGRT